MFKLLERPHDLWQMLRPYGGQLRLNMEQNGVQQLCRIPERDLQDMTVKVMCAGHVAVKVWCHAGRVSVEKTHEPYAVISVRSLCSAFW